MKVSVPAEVKNNEFRVAITPSGVHELVAAGHEVFIQTGAGEGSSISDAEYEAEGAKICPDAASTWAAGDMVLQTLANRIRECLRTTDDLGARIGGDELLIILYGVRGLQDALDIAEKLRRLAAEPIPTPAGPVSITLSVGVTLAHPAESTDALIARADDAMYQAKKRGRNQVVAIAEAGAGNGPPSNMAARRDS